MLHNQHYKHFSIGEFYERPPKYIPNVYIEVSIVIASDILKEINLDLLSHDQVSSILKFTANSVKERICSEFQYLR